MGISWDLMGRNLIMINVLIYGRTIEGCYPAICTTLDAALHHEVKVYLLVNEISSGMQIEKIFPPNTLRVILNPYRVKDGDMAFFLKNTRLSLIK